MKNTQTKLFLTKILVIFLLLSSNAFSQNSADIEQILPMDDIDQTYETIHIAISNMGFMVHVEVSASLKNYDDCSRKDRTTEGLNIEIDWYNTNDEAGKMMADLIKNDIDNIEQSFYSSSGFENLEQVNEVEIKGGKMLEYSNQKACVNEITGPSGDIEYFTKYRAFVYFESLIIKVDLKSNTKPETLKKSLTFILEESVLFDYSSLTDKF